MHHNKNNTYDADNDISILHVRKLSEIYSSELYEVHHATQYWHRV